MATHLQDRILASIKATLVAAAIVDSESVYLEGVDTIPAERTPALKIDAGSESVETLTLKAPRTQRRTFDIVVQIEVAQNDDYRVKAGGLLAQVERAMFQVPEAQFGGLAPDGLRLVATAPDRDGNSSRITYSIRTLWRVTYVCKEGASDRTSVA